MLTQSELKLQLNYDHNTGIFTWIKSKHGVKFNQKAGHLTSHGYIEIIIDKKRYYAHRLAWLYMYGDFFGEIDHIDRNPSNNSISNLRLCTSSQNKCNTRLSKKNTSGIKGISWNKLKNKWQVRITINKKTIALGNYENLEDAKLIIKKARQKYHGEFAN